MRRTRQPDTPLPWDVCNDRKTHGAALAVMALPLLAACGDADAGLGLTPAEVRETVHAALAGAPAPSAPRPSLTAVDAERIARWVVGLIPPRSAPADSTAFVAEGAIARYETQGRKATLAH